MKNKSECRGRSGEVEVDLELKEELLGILLFCLNSFNFPGEFHHPNLHAIFFA